MDEAERVIIRCSFILSQARGIQLLAVERSRRTPVAGATVFISVAIF